MKTFSILCALCVLCGSISRGQNFAVCDFPPSPSETNHVNGQYGLYWSEQTNYTAAPHYIGFCYQGNTSIVYDAAKVPNPAYFFLQYQVGGDVSPYSVAVLVDTNNFTRAAAVGLLAPGAPMNFRWQK